VKDCKAGVGDTPTTSPYVPPFPHNLLRRLLRCPWWPRFQLLTKKTGTLLRQIVFDRPSDVRSGETFTVNYDVTLG
jgi:hypothetical protein